uniref:Ig-like domain-containing protein n=1 Tax=Esox lucius TaxID=8010 RepID=A0A3P8Y5J9_ESOLU
MELASGCHVIQTHLLICSAASSYVGLTVGEEAVLPCFNHGDPNGTETKWKTKQITISWDSNQLTSRWNQMYMSDGRSSGNFSLIFTSLMLNHSGWYDCYEQLQPGKNKLINAYELRVCPKSEPLTEFFLEGEEVVLSCNSNLTDNVMWYRQTAQVNDVILNTRSIKTANYPKDLDGRINASDPPTFLVLFNLSLADRGEYWCAVFYKGVCVSVTKTVLVEWDPFGINSMFYRVYSSLMGCALLGMVCVLITVNLKTRRRDQASLNSRKTAAQTLRQKRNGVEEEGEEINEKRGQMKESKEEK